MLASLSTSVSFCSTLQEEPNKETLLQTTRPALNQPIVELPPLLSNLKNRKDELRFEKLVARSAIEAEQFRRSLLADSKLPGAVNSLAAACKQFQSQVNRRWVLQESQEAPFDVGDQLLAGNLDRFQLTSENIQQAISGNALKTNAATTYGTFEGKWYGIWDKMKVDHHWGPFVSLKQPLEFAIEGGNPVTLEGYQYAWVGDGYGLNHLASTNDGKQKFLLGYVVHVRNQDPKQEIVRRPHVGLIDGPGRLIWITKSEVFFEEMIAGEKTSQDKYVITGFRYTFSETALKATEGFQAIYSRDCENRVAWQKFAISIELVVKEK